MIVDKLIEVQKRWGKLASFSMTWAKNQKNEVVDIVKKLINESPNFGQGLTVSVQSMDHDVLENIKRRNLDQHKIDEIFALCDRNNIAWALAALSPARISYLDSGKRFNPCGEILLNVLIWNLPGW
jgi:hypothetical protein